MAQDPPLDPLLLGFFDGVPLTEQSVFDAPAAPTRILVFSENIALIAHDREKLEEELAITIKHEIGHYLGLDEDDLAARGLD
jgi:predicted Zn-dependent protease with MMP-like domain